MSAEQTQAILASRFEELLQSGDTAALREFLDDQNISEVAELVDAFADADTTIITAMSIHRAASVFKILDISSQKSIIHKLPAGVTASLLNELPADDRTDFLEELPSNVVRELIKLLDPEERKITLSATHDPRLCVRVCQRYR